jgi:hypothetical protein
VICPTYVSKRESPMSD